MKTSTGFFVFSALSAFAFLVICGGKSRTMGVTIECVIIGSIVAGFAITAYYFYKKESKSNLKK